MVEDVSVGAGSGQDRYVGRRGQHWPSLTETAQHYIDDFLHPTLLPFLQKQPRGGIYQHDNVRHHTARIVQTLLEDKPDNVLRWPACPPDMSQ